MAPGNERDHLVVTGKIEQNPANNIQTATATFVVPPDQAQAVWEFPFRNRQHLTDLVVVG